MIKGQFGIEWRKKQAGDGPSDFLCVMRETRKCKVGMENSNACRDPGGCGVGVGREHKSSPSVCCLLHVAAVRRMKLPSCKYFNFSSPRKS